MDSINMGIMANMIQPTSSMISTQMISKKDTDSSSNLSIDEMGISEDSFSSYDLDYDDLLSKSELTTAIDNAMSEFNGEMPSKEEFKNLLSEFGFEGPSASESSQSVQSGSLSTSQLDTISSVLSNYDADSLSQSDAQSIVKAFEEAGIEASSELASAMEDAGFDAQEVGTLAGVGGSQAQGGMMGPPPSGGGGGQMSSSEVEEVFDALDTNEDGVVSFDELQEAYGSSDSQTSELSSNQQNALDNLGYLMEMLKSNTNNEDSAVDTKSFDGLLKTINNQNNNSEINTYLNTSNTNFSSLFNYA